MSRLATICTEVTIHAILQTWHYISLSMIHWTGLQYMQGKLYANPPQSIINRFLYKVNQHSVQELIQVVAV